MNKTLLGTLLLALALGGLAWKISVDKAPQTDITRTALYVGLLEQLNDVTRVELRGPKSTTTLKRSSGQWTVANRDNFPADGKAVKRLLLQLADFEIVEAKTSLPDNYARIGVAEPGDGSDSLQVELFGATDNKLLAIIVGHARDSGQKKQRYVRRVGEAQSWLVTGNLDGTAEPITWLDARIADVDTTRVRRVAITPKDGPAVVIEKAQPKDNFYDLKNVPSGRVARSKSLVSSLGAVLLDLRFNSVAAAAPYAEAKPLRRTIVETFDGLRAQIDEFETDGKTYARFDFDYDATLVHKDDSKADAATAAVESPASDKASGDAATETVQQEVARLTARVAAWVYELPDYKTRLLSKRMDDLVQAATAAPAP